MKNIDDEGKIWLRGAFQPENGVRVGQLFFLTGQKDSEISACYIHENHLIVDLHEPDKKYRIIRKFLLTLKPDSSGTLFNGFTKTKHVDIKAVTYKNKGVEYFLLDGKEYLENKSNIIRPLELIRLAGWK